MKVNENINLYSVTGYDNLFINKQGDVVKLLFRHNDVSTKFTEPYKLFIYPDNRLYIKYCNSNKKIETISVAMLLANTFIPNPNSYKYVGYKDNDSLNIKLSNLYWINVFIDYSSNYVNSKLTTITDVITNDVYEFKNIIDGAKHLRLDLSSYVSIAKRSLFKPYIDRYKINIGKAVRLHTGNCVYGLYVYDHIKHMYLYYHSFLLLSYNLGIPIELLNINSLTEKVFYIYGYTISKFKEFKPFSKTKEECVLDREMIYKLKVEPLENILYEAYDYYSKKLYIGDSEIDLAKKLHTNINIVLGPLCDNIKGSIGLYQGIGFRCSKYNLDWFKNVNPYEVLLSKKGYSKDTRVYEVIENNNKVKIIPTINLITTYTGLSKDFFYRDCFKVGYNEIVKINNNDVKIKRVY